MKKVLNLFVIVCFLAGVAAFTSCKKTSIPTLTTTAISSTTTTSASSGGNITDDGGADVTARGVCWGTATKPEITGSKTSDSKGTGSFTSSITGLTPSTKYYVRAYATNSEGTAYGNELPLTTLDVAGASVTTTKPTSITSTTAVSGGNVTSDGGGTVTARGVCWGTAASPVATGLHLADASGGTGTFTSNITGLTPGATYHVRAYATNSFGTAYGADEQFNALAILPAVTTNTTVSAVTQTTASSGGNVTADGGSAVTARGVCWTSGTADPVVTDSHTNNGTGIGAFNSNLTQLTANTPYKVRAYATNAIGTAYGAVVPFTTSPVLLATVTTTVPSSYTASGAVTGGEVSASGGGTITARGVCYATTANPDITGDHSTDGAGTGTFTSTLSGLTDGTVYYVRAYATNSAGTAYGSQVQFLTMVADVEGYLYKTVLIGNQVWMAENLRTTKYNDNSGVTPVTDGTAWAALTTEAYCWYGNDETTNKPLYGAMYNWYAVNTGNLCPTGWHVPTDAEFKTLEMSLGMTQADADATNWRGTDQGVQLKNTTGWTSGNGTNTSGFSAMPGGYRYYFDGSFNGKGTIGYFWSTIQDSPGRAFMRQLDSTHDGVERANAGEAAGKSVRCLKN
jgi:uncharacterized protein (TIGR02145 family)